MEIRDWMSPPQKMKDKQHCRLLSEWLKYCPVLVHSRSDQKRSFLLHGKQVWTISNKPRAGKIFVKKNFASGLVLKIVRSFPVKIKAGVKKYSILGCVHLSSQINYYSLGAGTSNYTSVLAAPVLYGSCSSGISLVPHDVRLQHGNHRRDLICPSPQRRKDINCSHFPGTWENAV